MESVQNEIFNKFGYIMSKNLLLDICNRLSKLIYFYMYKYCVLLIGLLLISCDSGSTTNYYVNSISGNDALNGKSEANAWKSISKVNSKTFSPGDTIFFKRGCTWRETLAVPTSGNVSKNLVFSNYGKGPKPRIIGSTQVISWKDQGANIWKSSVDILQDPDSGYFKSDIYFVNSNDSVSWGKHKLNKTLLKADLDWTWSDKAIYIFSVSNPNMHYSSVEVPQRQQCIDLQNKEFIHINGIDMFFPRWSGVSYDWSYDMVDLESLIIENCHIAYVGSKDLLTGYGTEMAYSNMIMRHDTIHDCGRRGISLDIYGSGFTVKNVLIENCVFYSGFHTTGVDLSVGNGSYNASYDGVVIRQNIFYDEPATGNSSNHIFLQNYDFSGGGASVNNVFIYSNVFKYPSFSSIMIEGIQSCFIYNNTFYNHNFTKKGNVTHIWIDANNNLIKIKNNIFYSELNNDMKGNGYGLVSLTNASKIECDYNLFYRINNTLGIIYYNSKYNSSQLNSVQKLLGWQVNSPNVSDPLFRDPSRNDFRLKKGSSAIGSGIRISDVSKDYSGNYFNRKPSLGAFEFEPAVYTLKE